MEVEDVLPSRLDFIVEQSFPWITIAKRMPVILTQVVDEVRRRMIEVIDEYEIQNPSFNQSDHNVAEPRAIQDARNALANLSKLKSEMQRNKTIHDLVDTDEDCAAWNEYIANHRKEKSIAELKWMDASWLLAECYMYRRIKSCLLGSTLLASFDPFTTSKRNSYHLSLVSITGLGEVLNASISIIKQKPQSRDQLASTFAMFVQFALWGNKSDLSLHTNLDSEASKKLQVGTSAKIMEMQENILCDDTKHVWSKLCDASSTSSESRVDFVLDNAGFELFTDLCLGHWLIVNDIATTIHWHTKASPWFVSDTTNDDFHWVISQLEQSDHETLKSLGKSFRAHLESSKWVLKPGIFWTLPHEFSLIGEQAKELQSDMDNARVVLLKGDLNYRKLLADRDWPYDAEFAKVTRGFSNTSYCSLRTLKANLVCGLEADVTKRMFEKHPDGSWMTTGTYGLIQGSFTT